MGLLDYYKQFEGLSEQEVSSRLKEQADESRRKALATIEPLDLSHTEWHVFPHPDVVAVVNYAARRGINRAPDPHAVELRRELASRNGLSPEQVAAGDGAAGLLSTAAHVLLAPGDELLTAWPSYPLYPIMAREAGASAVPVPGWSTDALLSAVNDRTRVVAICNPNDPTGEHFSTATLGELLSELPDRVHVLVDEALVDYVDAEPANSTLSLLDDFPERLLIFRTFSKIHGLAGLRAGYAFGGHDAQPLIERLQPPLGLNALSQAGALEALQVTGPLVSSRRAAVLSQRARLEDELHDLPVDAPASQANLLWLSAPSLSRNELLSGLKERHVIAHPGANVGSDDHVRVTITGEPTASDRLLYALRKTLGVD